MGVVQSISDLIALKNPTTDSIADWAKNELQKAGAEDIRVIPGEQPKWTRGKADACLGVGVGIDVKLTSQAINGSPATPSTGVIGEVLPVASIAGAKKLGTRAKGAVIFFNAPTNPDYVSGGRFIGEVLAASLGAAAVIVRSSSADANSVSEPSSADFVEGKCLPTTVISKASTGRLMNMVKAYPGYHAEILLGCHFEPLAPTATVVGRVIGTNGQAVVMNSRMDSIGGLPQRRNDGIGAVEAIEALRLIRGQGWKPAKTVTFMLSIGDPDFQVKSLEDVINKEHGSVLIETDSLGFQAKAYDLPAEVSNEASAKSALAQFGVELKGVHGSGSGQPKVTFEPKTPRYFDYRRADKQTLAKLQTNEIEEGAAGLAMLAWILAR
jgi:hypothetical protein